MAPVDSDKEISRKALESEIGAPAARVAIKRCVKRYGQRPSIPDHEHLNIGDVILSRPLDRNGEPKSSPVETVQQSHGFSDQAAYWTHAMLYAGQMHIVEAQKVVDVRTGIRIRPLTAYAVSHDLLVLRYRHEEFTLANRLRIVRYALLSQAIHPRRYDRRAAWDALRRRRPTGTNHNKYINCSEFILECFATAGFLVEEYMGLQSNPDRFYLPANIHDEAKFEKFAMAYCTLTD